MNKLIRFIKNRYMPRGGRPSFAASGEDILISEALKSLGITKPSYIDIGAHHPVFGNNTYLFYRRGAIGVLIEPNISLCGLARQKRPRDIIVNAGAGHSDTTTSFYSFSQSTRSTFSKQQAEEWQKKSGQAFTVSSLAIYSLDTIIAKHCNHKAPDFISIDAEGYDIEILRGFSWKVRPKVFCIESLSAGKAGTVLERNREIYDLFESHDYRAYAETPANTIFVDALTKKE